MVGLMAWYNYFIAPPRGHAGLPSGWEPMKHATKIEWQNL